MQDELRAIIVKHCDTLRAEARSITDSLDEMVQPGSDAEACLRVAIGHAHKIKGSSGTIGFAEVSLQAKAFEMILRAFSRLDPPPSASEVEAARFLGAGLNATVAGLQPTDSSLFNADLTTRAAE